MAKQFSRGLATALKSTLSSPKNVNTWVLDSLHNGVQVGAYVSSQTAPIQVTAFFKAGSRYENYEKGEDGVTHILRRSVGLNTHKLINVDICRTLQQMGATVGASSTREHMIYDVKVGDAKYFHDILNFLGEISTKNKFNHWDLYDQAFKYAREDQERLYRVQHDVLLMELLHKAAYFDQPLGQSLFSSPHVLYDPYKHQFEPAYAVGLWGQYSEETFLNFQERCLQPAQDLTLLVSAGHDSGVNNPEELLEDLTKSIINDQTFHLHGKKLSSSSTSVTNNVIHGGNSRFERASLGKALVAVAFQGLPFGHEDELSLAVLLAGLSGGKNHTRLSNHSIGCGGLLAKAIGCEIDNSSCHVGSVNFQYADSGLTGFHLAGEQKDVIKGLQVVWKEVKRVAKEGLTDEQFKIAQNQVRADIAYAAEFPTEIAHHVGLELSLHGKHVPLDDLINKVSSLKVENVQKIAKKVFGNSSAALAAVGDVNKIPVIEDLAS